MSFSSAEPRSQNDLDQIQTVIEGSSVTIRSDNNGTKGKRK